MRTSKGPGERVVERGKMRLTREGGGRLPQTPDLPQAMVSVFCGFFSIL